MAKRWTDSNKWGDRWKAFDGAVGFFIVLFLELNVNFIELTLFFLLAIAMRHRVPSNYLHVKGSKLTMKLNQDS